MNADLIKIRIFPKFILLPNVHRNELIFLYKYKLLVAILWRYKKGMRKFQGVPKSQAMALRDTKR